ncbi:tRNA pseudouridine synthase Pus10-like [Styela clava]
MMGKNLCPRCIFMFLNVKDDEILRKSEEEIEENLMSRWPSIFSKEQILDSSECGEIKHFCHSCLGMLQDQFLHSSVENIAQKIQTEQYMFRNFRLMISQPVQFILFRAFVQHHYKSVISDHKRNGNGLDVKDIFKIVLEPKLEKALCSKAVYNDDAELEVTVVIKHSFTESHLLPKIEKCLPECFKQSKKVLEGMTRKRPRNDLTIFTLSAVCQASSKLSPKVLDDLIEQSYFQNSVFLDQIKILRTPIYVAGRYCKYSRELSQTPWIISGKRISEMSVQEYIADPIKLLFKADSYNFSSSGREDIDVRMLGNGRPFLLELVNPRLCIEEKNRVKKLQTEINEVTDIIKVRDLQIVSKNETKNLKDGEEGKTKSYSAVCYTKISHSRPKVNKLTLKSNILKLSELKNIKIEQKTPLRVLHRRNLAVRSRTIFELDVEMIDVTDAAKIVKMPKFIPKEYIFFKLCMTTQAGTYVKEFVHGDFGRTIPHVGILIGADTDILSLDVVSVNLEWPLSLPN